MDETTDATREVLLKDITIPKARLRETMHNIEKLAASMEAVGLLNPITVSEENVLISGLHRVRAAQQLGWETITASIFTGDAIARQLAEIDENLIRHDLTVVEQSDHVARREALLKARGERAERGGTGSNQHTSKPVTVTGLQTTEELAKAAGMSTSTYERRARIGRDLTEETKAIISELDPSESDLPNSTRQLNYLAAVDDSEDQEEIARMVATGEAASVWSASTKLKKAQEEEAEEKIDVAETKLGHEVTVVGIKKAGRMNYVVEWSSGRANEVPRRFLLKEGFKKCKHCSGLGITRGDDK